jgi:hypothetical protein
VVFSADNHRAGVAAAIESEIEIGIVGIPKERFGYRIDFCLESIGGIGG